MHNPLGSQACERCAYAIPDACYTGPVCPLNSNGTGNMRSSARERLGLRCGNICHERSVIIRRPPLQIDFARTHLRCSCTPLCPCSHGRRHAEHVSPLILCATRLHNRFRLPQKHGLSRRRLRRTQIVAHGSKGLGCEVPAQPQPRSLSTLPVQEHPCLVKRAGRGATHV